MCVGGTPKEGGEYTTSSDQENVSNRMQSNAQSSCSDLNSSLPEAVTLNLLKSSQCTDIECRKISNFLRTNESMFVAPQVELVMYSDLICKVNKGANSPYAIYVPQNLIGYFLKHYHDDSDHLSYTVVAKTISQNFYFPSLFKVIQDYVNKCGICQFDTTARFHKPVPSDLIELTDVPFAHICIDFVTHFQTSYSGNTYLLTIVDVATHFANAIPVKTLTAEECLDKLINFHFYKYGFPEKITSDNGRQFLSKLFTSYCRDHAIELINTSPRHPQSNGICERFNGTFSDMIKHSSLDDAKSWDELINKLLFTYNSSVGSSTKFSPSDLVFSYQVNDLNSRVDSPIVDKVNVEEFVVNTRLNSEDDRRQAHVNAVDSQIANKTRLDPLAKARKLNVGDKGLMKTEPNKKSKMKLRWHGPYDVVGYSSDKNYLIEINGQVRSYHIDLLKLYHDSSQNSISNVSSNSDDSQGVDMSNVAGVQIDSNNNMSCDTTEEVNGVKESALYNNSMINSISYMPIFDSAKRVNVLKHCEDPSAQVEIDNMISKYSDIFSTVPSTTTVLTHTIKLDDTTPFRKMPYLVPLAYRDKFKAELDKMTRQLD